MLIVKTLHTHRQSVNTSMSEGMKTLFLKRAWVGFQSDFTVWHHIQTRPQIADQAGDALRRKQTGRSPAYEHTVNLPPPHQWQTGFNIGTHGVKVSRLRQLGLAHFMGVEIAVGAFLQAPRQVNVNRQRRQRRQRQGACTHQMLNIKTHENQRVCINSSIAFAACPR